jgi:hypothetical protein
MSVDVRPGLRNYLLTDPNISAMVGGKRIYPVKNVEGNRDDTVIFIRILENVTYHMRGSTQLVGARFQLDSLSQSTDRAYSLSELVKERLGGASGNWFYGGNSPSDFVNVQGAFHLTGFEDFNEEAGLYRFSRDYMIWYEDS